MCDIYMHYNSSVRIYSNYTCACHEKSALQSGPPTVGYESSWVMSVFTRSCKPMQTQGRSWQLRSVPNYFVGCSCVRVCVCVSVSQTLSAKETESFRSNIVGQCRGVWHWYPTTIQHGEAVDKRWEECVPAVNGSEWAVPLANISKKKKKRSDSRFDDLPFVVGSARLRFLRHVTQWCLGRCRKCQQPVDRSNGNFSCHQHHIDSDSSSNHRSLSFSPSLSANA